MDNGAVDPDRYSNEPTPGKKTAHAYDVEARRGNERATFRRVFAQNRSQAAARVRRDGWDVCSVNMVG